ncbi:MAG: Gfo/Idh/MocA family oxidoreductase [Actinobacteria bacterium]|nr:Gfo/Idh/MocA family oxidoreductase [Actinomycetota bacterium]
MAKIRVGVIGAGSWALASHLPNLARHSDVEFVGVSRKGPEILQKIKDQYGFKVASEDFRDILNEGLDVCIVGSPSGFHYEHSKAALEAGAHVMCEKPMTVLPQDAWDLVETANQLKKHLVISFGWNYFDMVTGAKRLMNEYGIGTLEHISIHMSSQTRELLSNTGSYPDASPDALPESRTWTDPTLSGGGYGQAQLTHALGLSLWLTGARVESGFALMSAPMNAPVEMHDAIAYRFEGGAIGTLSGGSAHLSAHKKMHAVEMRAIGDRGQILVDLERAAVWHHIDGKETRLDLLDDAGLYDCIGPIDAIVSAGRGEEFTNESPGELGARTVEALDVAYRSAASGKLESR